MNIFCKILGIQKPIIQAPMLWITSPKLVAAVSNAGGLGVIGPNGGYKKPVTSVKDTVDEMRKTIRKTRELTDKPFGMNVAPARYDPAGYSKAILKLCKEEGVKILAAAGNISPEEFRQWKEDGFTLIAREINPTVRGAKEAEKAGADIIVATGCDEGGCMPSLVNGMASITALISDAVKIPVLAAGGIVNEKLVRAAIAVGAEGVYVGTRFMTSKECRLAQNFKEDIMNADPDEYIPFQIWNGENRWRSTPHKVAREALEENKKGNLNPSVGNCFKGWIEGDMDASSNTMANTSSLIHSIDSCKDIVNELAKPFKC